VSSALLRGLALLLGCALLGACSGRGDAPNVLIIVVDTLRRDHLGAYGYERRTSPEIDRLAADAVRYDSAQSQAPWTLPSVAALLTGRDVAALGIGSDQDLLDDEFLLLSEVLSEQGFATGGIVSHKFVSAQWGFDQGFDSFDDSQALGHMAVTSPAVTEQALAFLDAHQEGKFFLFLHYFDPHFAYVEHEGFRFEATEPYEGWISSGTRFKKLMRAQDRLSAADLEEMRRLYDSEIAFTDHHIGRVLEGLQALGLFDETLIVVTADHGEEFFEHGQIGHGKTLYEELVGVPLIVRFPHGQPGVLDQPVALVDIFPTVLELVGLEPGPELAGKSLLAAPDPERIVFASTERRGGSRMARGPRLKLIRQLATGPELYDLAADPAERENLLDGAHAGAPPAPGLERLRDALEPYVAGIARSPQRASRVELSREQRQQLEELGYLSPAAESAP